LLLLLHGYYRLTAGMLPDRPSVMTADQLKEFLDRI